MRRIGLFLVLVFLVLVGRGLVLVPYTPRVSDRYLWGAVHVHSELSDGLGSLDEVARAAVRSRLDFVMLSDHGAPHPEATLVDETLEGIRIVGGSEVGLPEGHLMVSDVDALPTFKLPPYPPDAIGDVREWGGLSIVTYPEDPIEPWLYWEDDLLPDGIEIINVTSYFRASSAFTKLRWAWFSMFSPYYYVSSFQPPTYALDRWDALLERSPVWGFYASNAHGGIPLIGETTLPIPSYETAFSYVGLGIGREYSKEPMRAIRSGDFFAVVRGAGEPERFTFRAGNDGRPGSFVPSDASLHVMLDAPELSTRIVIKRNGETLFETTENEFDFHGSAGVYRVEVFLEEHPLLARNVPWILSNPIFVGINHPSTIVEDLACPEVTPFALDELRLEKDDESEGSIEITNEGVLELSYDLSKTTPQNVDRWVALALRKPLDFSTYRGIVIEARAPATMRYWLEIRAREHSHYASFKVYSERKNRVVIPWSRFYAALGPRESPPLKDLEGLFITVNTSNSRTGFGTALTVTSLGGCR